ncbi:MAG: glycosyltransferase [Nocardioides sp.]|nr:glycosyltransferase [Nocardioides sp.]
MRIAYLVPTIYGVGGTASAIVTQANAMSLLHDVEVYSVYRAVASPHYAIADAVTVHDLVDTSTDEIRVPGLDPTSAAALRGAPPLLIDPAWDPNLDALADVGLEALLPTVTADVVVTVTPALLAAAVQLVPSRTAVVHQEHRSSSQRTSGLEPLLTFSPRADAVAMLTEPMATWLADQLGARAPEIVVMPNAVPPGLRPRSRRDAPLIVAAGRLTGEKQYPQLVSAFASIADRIPDWRLRIFGDGPSRFEIMSTARRLGMAGRVDLPGATTDLASEWAKASISALTSRSEGFPLVLQEAMAAGVPAVSYDCPSGPRAIIDDGVDGLLVAQDSEPALAAALLLLATDPALRDRLGDAALVKAATWDVETITARWSEVYEAAAARRGAAAGRSTTRLLSGPAPAPVDQHQAPAGAEAPGVTPEQARATALQVATSVAAGVCDDWFTLPSHTAETVLVLPMTSRRAFLDALAAADLPPYLSLMDPPLGGWPGRRGTPAALVPHLRGGRTSVALLEPWPVVDGRPALLAGCGVRVEFWEEGVDGELHHPPGQDAPLVEPAADTPRLVVDAVVSAGTGGRDELRHVLRSLHLFAPWVRRIHVAGAGPAPAWLDASHPTLELTDGPVGIPGAPGSAERLLHLDNHTFLGRPIRPERWFAPGGEVGHAAVDLGLADVQRRLRALLQRDQDCFRLVELHPPARAPEVVDTLVRDFLQAYFPVAAPWERD